MDALYLIKNRKSVFHFNKKEIESGVLADILNLAKCTPNKDYNQAWKFVVIKNKDIKYSLAEITQSDYLIEANIVIAIFSEDKKFKIEYTSAATEAMIIAANYHNIGVNWQACYNEPYSKKIEILLNAPKQMKLMSLVALGYYDFVSPVFKSIPSLSEIITYEKFK